MKFFIAIASLACFTFVSNVHAKSIHSDHYNSEDASHSHELARRSLDSIWKMLTGVTEEVKNVTQGRSISNYLGTDLQSLTSLMSSDKERSRSKRSIPELHKLIQEQNEQLQRLLRTLPGGSFLTPVAHDHHSSQGLFNPLSSMSNTLLFVHHNPLNNETTTTSAPAIAETTLAPTEVKVDDAPAEPSEPAVPAPSQPAASTEAEPAASTEAAPAASTEAEPAASTEAAPAASTEAEPATPTEAAPAPTEEPTATTEPESETTPLGPRQAMEPTEPSTTTETIPEIEEGSGSTSEQPQDSTEPNITIL